MAASHEHQHAADLADECRLVAARARRLLRLTNARIVRDLPGVDEERRRLAETAAWADALAAELSGAARFA